MNAYEAKLRTTLSIMKANNHSDLDIYIFTVNKAVEREVLKVSRHAQYHTYITDELFIDAPEGTLELVKEHFVEVRGFEWSSVAESRDGPAMHRVDWSHATCE